MTDREMSRVMRKLARRKWAKMTPEERAEQIRRMVAGQKKKKKASND